MYKNKIKMEIAPEILIQAIMNMKKKERESFLEDLLASTSPDYLESIKESREDYKAGRVKSHDEIFNK
jgi:PHD/YefM family antitoxin component YafN of YafNO toxin-antitoxin module